MIWLIAGVLLIAAEIISGDLFLLMLGGAALAAAGSSVLGAPLLVDILVFAGMAFGLVGFARPILRRRLTAGPHLETNAAALIGATAVVVSPVDASGGRVRIGGDEWSARTMNGQRTFDIGESVTVMEISGATAIVWGES